jgi:hypothetical protein
MENNSNSTPYSSDEDEWSDSEEVSSSSSDESISEEDKFPPGIWFFVEDIQGFQISTGDFILKEVAVSPLETDHPPKVYLAEPPCEWDSLLPKEQKVNSHLTKRFHGIPWERGTYTELQIKQILSRILKRAAFVYVKGEEKQRWLHNAIERNSV